MSLYFLHVANDDGITMDESGREFPDAEQAIVEASRTAGAILADELREGRGHVSLKVYVEDEQRNRRATVSLIGTLAR